MIPSEVAIAYASVPFVSEKIQVVENLRGFDFGFGGGVRHLRFGAEVIRGCRPLGAGGFLRRIDVLPSGGLRKAND